MSRRNSLVVAALTIAVFGGVAFGAHGYKTRSLVQLERARVMTKTAARHRPAKMWSFLRANRFGEVRQTSVSNLLVNGQNPSSFALGDTVTVEFAFDGGESIAYVHLFIDVDGDSLISQADKEVDSGGAFVDNSDMDEDPSVGSFRVTFPSLGVFPAVTQYILALESSGEWETCVISVTEPATDYSISGDVTLPPLTPGIVVLAMFPGAEVEGTEEMIIATFTDTSGHFYIPVPEPLANDTAMVMAYDFMGVTGGYLFSFPATVFVDGHVSGLSLEMAMANAWVRVTVQDQYAAPVPGVSVYAGAEGPGSEAVTDSTGVAVLGGMGGQRVWIDVDSDQLWPTYSSGHGIDTVMVLGDTLDVFLPAYQNDSSIEGYVYQDGLPKPGARLHAWSEIAYSYGWTDINGYFSIPVYSGVERGYWLSVDEEFVPEGYFVRGDDRPVKPGEQDIRIDLLRAQGEIFGYVVDASTGDPIEHAWVWAQSDTFAEGGETDEDGYYNIPVMNGFYEVNCYAEGYFPDWDTVNVADASVQVDFSLEPFVSGYIAGYVYDVDGNPLGGVEVVAETDSGMHWHAETWTADDGSYLLEGLIPGNYRVWALGDFWARAFYPDTSEYGAAALVPVFPADTTWGIDFHLEPGGAITGVVTDANTGEPLPECDVHAWNVSEPWQWWNAWTDENGTYVLRGLPAGSYHVEATCWEKGYIPQRYLNQFPWEPGDTVVVQTLQYTEGIDFALLWGAAIAGTVIDTTYWMGIPDAHVVAEAVDGTAFYEAYTDSSGYFFIAPIPPGEYYVSASAEGYGTGWYPGGVSRDSAQVLQLHQGDAMFGLEFRLGPGTGVARLSEGSLPTRFALHRAFPNPFNPETALRYDVPQRARVTLTVFDAMGRRVKVLVQKTVPPGRYMVCWDGTNELGEPVASGVYVVVMRAGEKRFVTKATLLK